MVEVVSSQGEVLSELVFNTQTGCLGANTLQVSAHGAPGQGTTGWGKVWSCLRCAETVSADSLHAQLV